MMTFERLGEVLGLSQEQVEAVSVGTKRPYSDDDQEGNSSSIERLHNTGKNLIIIRKLITCI